MNNAERSFSPEMLDDSINIISFLEQCKAKEQRTNDIQVYNNLISMFEDFCKNRPGYKEKLIGPNAYSQFENITSQYFLNNPGNTGDGKELFEDLKDRLILQIESNNS